MSELRRLIQSHLDKYGVTRSEFARRAGTTPQTVQNWWDKPKTLPRAEHLRGVAEVIGVPYLIVLDAALVDAGYRDSVVDDVATISSHISKLLSAELEQVHDQVLTELAARVEDHPKRNPE